MKTIAFESRDQWLEARKGKVTGTRLGDIIPKKGGAKKIGFYELIAERLMVSEAEFDGYVPNETPMDRGTRLQAKAIERFSQATGKAVNDSLVLWVREDNENIAISPDGVVKDALGLPGDFEAVETKCLSAARHIEAWITQKVPSDYEYQALQYFIVNDKLQTLYFCFYDPRIPCKDFFFLALTRAELELEAMAALEVQTRELREVDEWVKKLSAQAL